MFSQVRVACATTAVALVASSVSYADPPRKVPPKAQPPINEPVPTSDSGLTKVATWSGSAKGVISLGFDDNREDHWRVAAPEMTARGLRGTFHVNPGAWQWPRWHDQYVAMANAGHELASHTMNHRYCIIKSEEEDPQHYYFHSLQELRDDCEIIRGILQPINHRAMVTIAYPGGQIDSQTMPVVMSYFVGARTSTNGPLTNDQTPVDMGFLLATRVGAGANSPVWGDYQYTRDTLTSYLQLAEQSQKWVIYEHHDVQWPGYSGVNLQAWLDHLDELVAAQAAGRVWVATEGDVLRYIKERDAAQVSVIEHAAYVEVSVNDGLDDSVFDVPLTLETIVPPTWMPTISVLHGGMPVQYEVPMRVDGVTTVRFDAPADGSVTRIQR